MDATQALRDAENALRDFIAEVLIRSVGTRWLEQCGVSEDRLSKWEERKKSEQRRQAAGVVEERLIYYADFYDLRTILKKHWSGEFSTALGDWKTIDVYLGELEKLRDPDAHRRELLPHQKHLILGISGEIRNRLVRYRSKQETLEDYFPRIESARDSLGSIWVPGGASPLKVVPTNHRLRPGDVIEFTITASDPLDDRLEYGILINALGRPNWQTQNEFSVTIAEQHVGDNFFVRLCIRSPRRFHAKGDWDDSVEFYYCVLPPR